MAPLNKMYLDEIIIHLQKVCETKNAYSTYKQAGWKSTFNKKKMSYVKEKEEHDRLLRMKEMESLPPELHKKLL